MAYCRDALLKCGFDVYHSTDKNELAEMISDRKKSGDVLLFKGSRGMKMEEIAEKIK